MELTRRNMMLAGTSAFAVATFCGIPVLASAVDEHIADFTGGFDAVAGVIELDAPEIAENGNTVPITVSAPGASSIMILAAGNPVPAVATFNFGPMSAARRQRASRTGSLCGASPSLFSVVPQAAPLRSAPPLP